jgi:DNA repair photolyase
MPECGSQAFLCNLPVRFDTYSGCSHGCKYCFVYRKYDISKIKKNEGPKSLRDFIEGKRTKQTNWADWNIPLHWGGVSDPFQPAELHYKNSLDCLKVFAETKYPFVVSTKSVLPTMEPYYSILKECNFVYQVSMLSPDYDKLEPNCYTYEQRLNSLYAMAKIAKRVIVRLQPYIIDYHKNIISYFKRYKEVGVYGVTAEAIKFQKAVPGTIRLAGDNVYPVETLKPKFIDLKMNAHKHGLKFFSGENRLRGLGDGLTCCGTDGVPGFIPNYYNLNQFIYDKSKYKPHDSMKEIDTAYCFKSVCQTSVYSKALLKSSFHEMMQASSRDKAKLSILLEKPL